MAPANKFLLGRIGNYIQKCINLEMRPKQTHLTPSCKLRKTALEIQVTNQHKIVQFKKDSFCILHPETFQQEPPQVTVLQHKGSPYKTC